MSGLQGGEGGGVMVVRGGEGRGKGDGDGIEMGGRVLRGGRRRRRRFRESSRK